MDKLSAMHVFVTIVEQGSMSAAADHLDMSRTKITRYLSELETWMDTQLLHRTTRSLSLTATGEETLEIAREMLSLQKSLVDIRDKNAVELKGLLRVTASQSIARNFLTYAISSFVQIWPHVSVEIISTDETINLVNDRIDLAVRITNNPPLNAIAKKLGVCHSVLCASPAYLDKYGEPANVQELTEHNCLSFNYFSRTTWEFDGPNGLESIPVKGNVSSNNSEVLLSATLANSGISLQPLPAAYEWIQAGKLIHILPQWQAKTLNVYAIYQSRKQMTPLLRAFIDHLSSEINHSIYRVE